MARFRVKDNQFLLKVYKDAKIIKPGIRESNQHTFSFFRKYTYINCSRSFNQKVYTQNLYGSNVWKIYTYLFACVCLTLDVTLWKKVPINTVFYSTVFLSIHIYINYICINLDYQYVYIQYICIYLLLYLYTYTVLICLRT